MARRAGGRCGGRMVPGLAAALIEHYRTADGRWHMPEGVCCWCSQVAELLAGRAVQVDALPLHGLVDHQLLGCSGIYCHDSQAVFIVTGDRWEAAEREQRTA